MCISINKQNTKHKNTVNMEKVYSPFMSHLAKNYFNFSLHK